MVVLETNIMLRMVGIAVGSHSHILLLYISMLTSPVSFYFPAASCLFYSFRFNVSFPLLS